MSIDTTVAREVGKLIRSIPGHIEGWDANRNHYLAGYLAHTGRVFVVVNGRDAFDKAMSPDQWYEFRNDIDEGGEPQ